MSEMSRTIPVFAHLPYKKLMITWKVKATKLFKCSATWKLAVRPQMFSFKTSALNISLVIIYPAMLAFSNMFSVDGRQKCRDDAFLESSSVWTRRKHLQSAEDCLFFGVCPVGCTGQAVWGGVDSGGKPF